MRAWCIWCECGDRPGNNGYYWIHMDCAHKLMDLKDDLQQVRQILEGTHTRNKDNADKLDVVVKFLNDLDEFEQKWQGTMRIIRGGEQNQSQG